MVQRLAPNRCPTMQSASLPLSSTVPTTHDLTTYSLERLEWMTSQERPFYLEIAPASPHVRPGGHPTVPLARHKFHFPGIGAPRTENWNPDDHFQRGKSTWIRDLPKMEPKIVDIVDRSYRARLQGLQGVDEIVGDIVTMLREKGVLDETYG